jgi:hypothetical protein
MLAIMQKRTFAQSSGMPVEAACLGNVLFLLLRHFRGVFGAWHTTRPEFSSGDLVLGKPFFVAGRA